MLPVLKPGQIVIGMRTRNLSIGHVVIIRHDGIEKIKRIMQVHPDEIYVLGDNPVASTDSRTFGWIPEDSVIAKIIWPRI